MKKHKEETNQKEKMESVKKEKGWRSGKPNEWLFSKHDKTRRIEF